MGIPSYYRKLTRSCPRLIQSSYPASMNGGKRIQWFFMDYNCLIYHCLHRPDAPVYPLEAETDESVKQTWTTLFIESVLDYTIHVIHQVMPEKGVYIAIDGVVPMAKMRQQRLRRFKSSWMASMGMSRDGKRGGDGDEKETARWNTNAITPGTEFMDQLHTALLRRIQQEGKSATWTISSCREPGEGEHKIMTQWRRGIYQGPIAVYGLDADLIVLSLLGIERCNLQDPVWLFREAMERGSIQYDMFGQESYEWFSIRELRQWLVKPYLGHTDQERSFILHYTFMMSFLGNDFLPSSLSYKMRDDGHSLLLDHLHDFFSRGQFLVDTTQDTLPIQFPVLLSFFQILALQEPKRIFDAILKKQEQARWSESAIGMREVGHDDWPLFVLEESILLFTPSSLSSSSSSVSSLHSQWKHRYLTHFFHGFSDHSSSYSTICYHYLYGVQWIWAYYLGKMDQVCFEWYYPYSLPPLWEWLGQATSLPPFEGTVRVKPSDIQPTEQLALVLPLDSWYLLPPCPQRELPYRAPHLFPSSFSFDSVGKRFFWECESMIPLPTISEVKAWCSSS